MRTASTKLEKRVKAQNALTRQKVGAGEPTWERVNSPGFDSELAMVKALNWYATFSTDKDEQRWAIEYVRNLKGTDDSLGKLPAGDFTNLGRHLRMLDLGAPVSKAFTDKILGRLGALIFRAKMLNSCSTKKPVNLQDRTVEKSREICGEILQQVSAVISSIDRRGKIGHSFSLSAWLNEHQIKAVHCGRIAEMLESEMADYTSLVGHKPDPQLMEAYRNNTVQKNLAAYNFLRNCLNEVRAYSLTKAATSQRKPRKKKVKTPEKQVAKLKYLATFEGRKSIDPRKIVGAQYLLAYNTRYRKLMWFVSASPEGFSVKGSTILNFDEKESKFWKIRKPTEMFKILGKNDLGIRETNKYLKSLSTKATAAKGRINKDCLILNTI